MTVTGAAIAEARRVLAEVPPRFGIGTQIKTKNSTILQGPKHSDMDGWRAQFMAAFGTSSATVVNVEVERIEGSPPARWHNRSGRAGRGDCNS